MQLICRNDVEDFAAWKVVFYSDHEARMHAGMSMLQLWRDADRANHVWMLFDVNDRGRAQGFMDDPRSEQMGKKAGMTDSEYHFVETL